MIQLTTAWLWWGCSSTLSTPWVCPWSPHQLSACKEKPCGMDPRLVHFSMTIQADKIGKLIYVLKLATTIWSNLLQIYGQIWSTLLQMLYGQMRTYYSQIICCKSIVKLPYNYYGQIQIYGQICCICMANILQILWSQILWSNSHTHTYIWSMEVLRWKLCGGHHHRGMTALMSLD